MTAHLNLQLFKEGAQKAHDNSGEAAECRSSGGQTTGPILVLSTNLALMYISKKKATVERMLREVLLGDSQNTTNVKEDSLIR